MFPSVAVTKLGNLLGNSEALDVHYVFSFTFAVGIERYTTLVCGCAKFS
jgi:hypothetical protein